MAAQRVIFHCDCNSFYASVELLTRPELKNVPVAVCGNPQHRHGIILAKNEAAKSTAFKRRRLWPAPGASARSLHFCPRTTSCTAPIQNR